MRERECRRHAAGLAAQLPDEKEDAMQVIVYLQEIAEGYLFPDRDFRPAPLKVVKGA